MQKIPVLSKTEKFPRDAIMGEMIVLKQTQDLYVFDGIKWVLVGGQYLPKKARENIYEYFDDGWERSSVLKYDLLHYLDISNYWEDIFYNRILHLASKILPEE